MPVLALLGLGSSAAGAFVQGARPYLIPVTVALLGVAFFYAYVRRPSTRNKVLAWIATVVSAASIAYGLLAH